MINVTSDFKTRTKKIKQQNIKLGIVDGELTVKDVHFMPVKQFNALPVWMLRARKEVIAKELKYSFEGKLFKTIMKQVEITVKNAGELKDKNVNFQYGIYVNNNFKYIDLGDYYIKDVDDDKGKTELIVTGYDKMIHFMKTFKQSELQLTYPCTMLALVQKMCEVCGVELYSTNFFNSDLQVNEDYFTVQELTYRDVLEKVAESTLTTIFIKDNKLYLHKLADSPVEKIDSSYLTGLTVKEKFGPVNALVLGRGDVEDNIESKDDTSISQNGRCEIRFDENEFVEYQREQVIDEMFEQIKGLEYYSFEGSDVGIMWLEPCDLIEVEDSEGSTYKTIYLKANITINTGISSDTGADILEETNTKYRVTTKEEKKTLKVERLAKKNEGLIKDIIEENTETSEKLTEVEQTIDGITQKVSSVEEKVETVEDKADNAQTSANKAQSTADSANDKIDNLSVGARNLLLSTQTQNTEKGNTITGAVKTGEKFLNCDVFRSSNAWASIGFNLKRVIEDNNLKVGDKVTYSIYNKTDDTVARDIALYTSPLSADGTGSRELKLFKDTLNTEWTRLVVTFEITETMMNCKETNNLRTRYECKTACTTGKYQYWCAPKLELGTIATDWTPAPEDVEDNLTTNYYTKTETNSQIDQKANQITQTVSETYSTKTETTNAKQEAIDSANASTDEKLEDYSTTTEMNSAITQKANEITQQVDTKYDYLRDAVQTNEIKLQDTVAGQGYVTEFKIKGNTSNFKYLAPSDTLVPSNTLVPLGDHFTIVCDKQTRGNMSNEAVQVDVKLSEPLRNVGEIYDELNIIDGKTTVTRRIGVNSDLSLYVLSTEVTETLQDTDLTTFDGETYIYIKEYTGMAYTAKYMIKNDYSDKFITKMEANSKIEEKANSIIQSVSQEFTTKDETKTIKAEIELKIDVNDLVSILNASADIIIIKSNRLIIDSDKFKLSQEGDIEANGGEIGGFKLTKNSFTSDFSGIYDYNEYDLRLAMCEMMEFITPDSALYDILDGNEDGNIDSGDSYVIKRILLGLRENTKSVSGTLEINTQNPKNNIAIKKDGQLVVGLGAGGINTNALTTGVIACGYATEDSFDGVTIDGTKSTITIVKDNNHAGHWDADGIQTTKILVENNIECWGNINIDSGRISSLYTYNNDINTNAPNLYITSSGNIRRTTGSSERYKKDITEEIEERLNPEALYNLPIKQFKYKEDSISKDDVRYDKNILGFIAEDVAEIYEPAVQYDEQGQIEMWNAQVMIPAMLKLIQEQHKEIQELKSRVEKLEEVQNEKDNI